MKSKRLPSLLCVAAATSVLALPATIAVAQTDPAEVAVAAEALPNTWFVELKNAPAADGTSTQVLRAEKQAFRAAAAKAGVRFQERYAFDTLWNGLSVTASRSDINRIRSLPGVAAVWPVAVVEAPPKGEAASPELFAALAMTGADVAQDTLGYSGAGVKVAVMDTGIDIDHPAFGGSGVAGTTPFPTARITHGWDFVGDAYNADPGAASYNPTPAPDGNPDDCGGHGSHVAGIVGANDPAKGLRGVAPGVTFGAYRVFGCAGSTTADIMIAAMERALADGMDVLNMSIGSSFQWPQYPTAEASNRLVNKGIVVVASIGNSGANGLYAAGAPGLGKKVIGTASFDNAQLTQPAFTVNPGNLLVGFNNAAGSPIPPTSGTTPIAQPANVEGCNAADFAGFPPGTIALVRRGTCTFHVKALNSMNAGASAVVLYNNTAGALNPTVAGTTPITIPVVAITQSAGTTIAGIPGATLTWGTSVVTIPNANAGLISSFSSYGLSPDLTLKPDIGAPGGSIFSSIPLELGGYGNNSGTSMSSPHVAGSVALLLEAKPDTSAQSARTILQNSADPKAWWGNPGLGFLDNVHRQGAGMVDIPGAILSTTNIEPGKLSLGESEAGPATRTLTIENNGASDVTYDLSHSAGLATGPNTFTPAFFSAPATVAFSAPSVTVPAGGTASVDVSIAPNATLADKSQYGGYVVFTPQGGGATYRVPFAGFKGDYQSIQVLVPTASGFPWLSRITACTPRFLDFDCGGTSSYTKAAANPVFTMQWLPSGLPDVPYLAVHLDHHSRLFRVEIFGENGKTWHRAYNEDYMPRNSTATGIFAFPLDGTTFAGNRSYTLPDGNYYARISVLKALGDSANPAHWETWNSPVFTIDRP